MIGLAMASIYYMNEKKLSSHLTSEAKFDEGDFSMNKKIDTKLTRKDHLRTALRWTFIGSNTVNFGTLQGAGYAWAIANILRKLYPNDDDYKKQWRSNLNISILLHIWLLQF